MRIFVVNLKRMRIYICTISILIAVLLIVGVNNSNILQVFSGSKLLPVYSVDIPDKKVALTFDCAWGDEDIPDILNALGKEDVKATFFIVGQWADKFPDTVRRISSQGHDIANHSYSHLRMGLLDSTKIKSEVLKCDEKLYEITGNKVDLFRAPFGDYNDDVVSTVRNLGHQIIQWDVDSLDWKNDISKEEIIKRVTSKVKNGSIILFHNDTQHTANILPDIINALRKEGYGFLPVSSLIMKDNYYIDYDGRQKSHVK